MENLVINKDNVKEVIKKQTRQIIYKVIFKEKNWIKGTKNDPKKEFGTIKLAVKVPKGEDDYYIKDMDFFIDSEDKLPKAKIEPFAECYAVFEFNEFNPEASGRFVKIVE